ncbi:MAG: hydroxyacid dehydrogenase [Hyphomicrobiaceae bacterium]|nr:hydroxyacid dehydrogenase [Hyphomicrobiaceae bacterium]
MKRVLITEPIHQVGLDILKARGNIEVVHLDEATPEALSEAIPGVHGIAVRTAYLTEDILSKANALEVVSRHGVGCDRIAVDHLSGRGIPLAIAAGANAQAVAEHTLMLMLSVARRLFGLDGLLRNGRWHERDSFCANDLFNSKMLIVGFGRIGRRVVPLCKAFGMNVVVADIALDADLAESMDCRGVEDFHTELADADFISLHVPLDESTRHLISSAEFEAMKPGAILVNCARGGIVDEEALVDALDSGHLGGAGIDVFGQEPLSKHPLFERSNTVLTPHHAAASYLSKQEMARMAAQNIVDCFDGRLREDCIFNLDALKNGS